MEFTHLDKNGNAIMVDVSEKPITSRSATATGFIQVNEEIIQSINDSTNKKGDVLQVARIAAIMATKKTSELIPLCHGLNLTKVSVDFEIQDTKIYANCTVKCDGKTGVEMEALTGVNIALLTIYDMCKAISKSMVISNIHLINKSGGKSGDFAWQES